jgi:GNAT superfamily N-acetyltransferase
MKQSNASYEIRPIAPQEITKGQRLIPEFDEPFPTDLVHERLKGRDVYAFGVFDVKGGMAGFSVAYNKDSDDTLYCWVAGVLPDHRKQGLYEDLAHHREAWARMYGYKSLTLKTYNRYQAMISFLAKDGWDFVTTKTCTRTGGEALYYRKELD